MAAARFVVMASRLVPLRFRKLDAPRLAGPQLRGSVLHGFVRPGRHRGPVPLHVELRHIRSPVPSKKIHKRFTPFCPGWERVTDKDVSKISALKTPYPNVSPSADITKYVLVFPTLRITTSVPSRSLAPGV